MINHGTMVNPGEFTHFSVAIFGSSRQTIFFKALAATTPTPIQWIVP
jgi:hypothetical protein